MAPQQLPRLQERARGPGLGPLLQDSTWAPPLAHRVTVVKQLAPRHRLHKMVQVTVVAVPSSVMSDSVRPPGLQHTRLPCPSPSPSLLKPMSIESVMPSNHLILCRPLLLLPSIFPSIGVFPNELALCIWWPKHWSSSFSTSPSGEYQ